MLTARIWTVINSYWHRHQCNGSSLVRVMACHLFGVEPLTWITTHPFSKWDPGTNINEIWIKIQQFSFKVSSAKRWPLCTVLTELTHTSLVWFVTISYNSRYGHTIHDWMTIIPYFNFSEADQWEKYILIQMWVSFRNSAPEQNHAVDITEYKFVSGGCESNHQAA